MRSKKRAIKRSPWILYTTAAIVVAGLALLAGSAVFASNFANAANNKTLESLVFLYTTGDNGICSGVHIGSGLILTAGHCPNGDTLVETSDLVKSNVPAAVAWVSKRYDVALLEHAEIASRAQSSELSCRIPRQGEAVEAGGHPVGMRWLHMRGHVAKQGTDSSPARGWGSFITLDISIGPGMSGGPLWDTDKKLVGMNIGIHGDIDLGFSVPGKTLCTLLGRV